MPRMLPDGKTTLTYKPLPNINRVEPHQWCQGNVQHTEVLSSRVGDVRVCKHGKIQMRTETYSTRVAGPGTDWWQDLHWFWTPILWRRAKAALTQWEQY